jgi:hypothetical protein
MRFVRSNTDDLESDLSDDSDTLTASMTPILTVVASDTVKPLLTFLNDVIAISRLCDLLKVLG